MSRKRRVATLFLICVMVVVGLITYPINNVMFSKQFWVWATVLLGGTIFAANVFLQEDQYALFEQITHENFVHAPIFGVLSIPFVISLTAAGIITLHELLLMF